MDTLFGACYSSRELAELTGLTYRQLDDLDRPGLLVPSIPATGSGSRRGYSDVDLARARVAAALIELGCARPVLARVLEQLGPVVESWPDYTFIAPDGSITLTGSAPACWVLSLRRILHPEHAATAAA